MTSPSPAKYTADTDHQHVTILPADYDVTPDAFSDILVNSNSQSRNSLNLPLDLHNTSFETTVSDTSLSASASRPFKSYSDVTLKVNDALYTRQARSADAKTVTFSGADQVVLLSPARSVDSSHSSTQDDSQRKKSTEVEVTIETSRTTSTGSHQLSPETRLTRAHSTSSVKSRPPVRAASAAELAKPSPGREHETGSRNVTAVERFISIDHDSSNDANTIEI